jgi:hypothetical protein
MPGIVIRVYEHHGSNAHSRDSRAGLYSTWISWRIWNLPILGKGNLQNREFSMEVIQCTKKLQKEIGTKPSDLFEAVGDSLLGPWHANLIHIFRRKCILFANDKTYFSFLAVDVSRAEMRDMQRLFTSWLTTALDAHDVDKAVIDKILNDYSEIKVGKTSSRSVLGVMNDQAYTYKLLMERTGSLPSVQFADILRNMNRVPCGAIGYRFPCEELAEAIRLL